MKKFIFSFTLVAILFAFSFERGEATCPTGYVQSVYSTTFYGCEVKFETCWQCDPTSVNAYGYVNSMTFTDAACFAANSASLSLFYKQAAMFLKVQLQNACSKLPCGDSYYYIIHTPKCIYIEYTIVSGIEYWSTYPCDQTPTCVSIFEDCWDYSNPLNPVIVHKSRQDYVTSTPDCPYYYTTEHPNPNPSSPNVPGPCFQIKCIFE